MNFLLRFVLNLSITPLLSKEINELYAEFRTKFVYYSLIIIIIITVVNWSPLCKAGKE